jgi:hypothetical protein
VLNVPPYLGAGLTLAAGFALATCSIFLLATRAGLNAYLAIALGFLYAAGPYLCLNLFVRNAFPEYLTWQVVPALLLVVQSALRPGAGPLAMLAGALAFAAPFYLHKLVAPHVALTLALLGLNAGMPYRAYCMGHGPCMGHWPTCSGRTRRPPCRPTSTRAASPCKRAWCRSPDS